jgi:hypothetical protein
MMTGLGTLARLVWRPAALLVLLLATWAAALPMLILWEEGRLDRAPWLGVVLVPALLGLALSWLRLELQHTFLSTVLPGLRRRLLAGTLLLAILVAGAAGVVVGPAPWPATLATAAVALFWFAAGSMVQDVAFPRALRWPLILAFIPAAFRPAGLQDLIHAWPWAVTALSVPAAVGLMVATFSRRAARARPFLWSPLAPGNRTQYWAGRTGRAGRTRAWRESLATERLGPWLRAAMHESSGGRFSFQTFVLLNAFMGVVWGQLMGMTGFFIIMAGLYLSFGRAQLTSGLFHPLGRADRARLAVAGAGVEAAALAAAGAMLVLVVLAAGVPTLPWFTGEGRETGWALVIAVSWAWAPVAQWPAIRWPASGQAERPLGQWFGWWALFVVAATASALLLAGRPPLLAAGAIIAVAGLTQSAFVLAVRRHYASGDLLAV